MARQNVVLYNQEWMQKLMEETVLLRLFLARVCADILRQENAVTSKEDWDVKAALEHYLKDVPKCEIQGSVAKYVTDVIKDICESGDPFVMHDLYKELRDIYRQLENVENMFNIQKLEALKVWPRDLL